LHKNKTYIQDESLLCDSTKCHPHRVPNVFGQVDYPMDEWTLAQAFNDTHIASEWLDHHFEKFVTRQDLLKLVNAGVTHVRVPLPHFILNHVLPTEPWVVANRWKYFLRLLDWCRELSIQVWPDMHTAPGSQNGFDNSGQALASGSNCQGWSGSLDHVQRLLTAIRNITREITREGYGDVVTGFGLLNEPFKDCDKRVYDDFVSEGLAVVRQELGNNTHVYIR
jgi:glucan 1,3-beta-glucosidase